MLEYIAGVQKIQDLWSSSMLSYFINGRNHGREEKYLAQKKEGCFSSSGHDDDLKASSKLSVMFLTSLSTPIPHCPSGRLLRQNEHPDERQQCNFPVLFNSSESSRLGHLERQGVAYLEAKQR